MTRADAAARGAGRRGRPLRTLLDRDVQAAAEQALDGRRRGGARRGPAVDRRRARGRQPARATPRYDRALLGRYPPGSTFKVVTTAALLRAGLHPRRDGRLPGHARRRRQVVPQLRGRRRRRGAVPRGLRAELQHRVRLARRPARARRDLTRGRARLRAGRAARAGRARGRRRRPAAARRRRPGGDDDRPGPDPREPARDGRRRRHRRRRPLARAAAARDRAARAPARRSTRGELATLRELMRARRDVRAPAPRSPASPAR